MSLVYTGKLLIRFIKDFSSIIMEPRQIPKPVIHKDFYTWFGVIPEDDKKIIVKLPPLPKFDKSHNTKIWNFDVEVRRRREKAQEIETMPTWWHP
jgi:hypothetical protein